MYSSLEEFAGSAVCAQCHKEISASQRLTPMARTLSRADGSAVLREHPELGFDHREYKFRISTANGKSIYSVSNGKEKISALLAWAFGLGHVGQSYLYERDGAWYEARSTYFPTLNDLEFTPTRALDSPRDIAEAMARPLGAEEMRRCFQCHATGVTTQPILEQTKFTNGLLCEACHGPGAKHVAAKRAEKLQQGEVSGAGGGEFIFNARTLSPGDSVDFCGSCHATWWGVRLTNLRGVPSVRSQPYRLQNSKCWGQATHALPALRVTIRISNSRNVQRCTIESAWRAMRMERTKRRRQRILGKRVRWRPRNVLHATCRRSKFQKCTMRLPIMTFA
jgi:hypothetical protein